MDTLPNPLGGERRVFIWRDHRISYVVRGEGPPMVLVHAIHATAWNMEWRYVVPGLAQRFTCFAIDLIGFGASDRPSFHYTASLYSELLDHFLAEVVGAPAVVVGSSLGGTYVISLAHRRPELVRAVVAIGPAGVTRLAAPAGLAGRATEALIRSPIVGDLLFDLLTSRLSISFFLSNVYADRAALSPETIKLFWLAARHPNARFAPAAFVGFRLNCDIGPQLPELTRPFLLVWGERAKQTPLSEAAPIRALAREHEFAVLPGGDLPHAERPEAFTLAVFRFVERVRERESVSTVRMNDESASGITPGG